VDTTYEQMVYAEATLALPLIAGYALHKGAAGARKGKNWTEVLSHISEPVSA
jgi:deoxyhypusine synthase